MHCTTTPSEQHVHHASTVPFQQQYCSNQCSLVHAVHGKSCPQCTANHTSDKLESRASSFPTTSGNRTHSMAVQLQTQGMAVLLETQLVYARIHQCCNKSKVLNLCSGLKWLRHTLMSTARKTNIPVAWARGRCLLAAWPAEPHSQQLQPWPLPVPPCVALPLPSCQCWYMPTASSTCH